MNIQEDYVSFEVAKLLKEKGYCNISNTLYKKNGEFVNYNVGLNNKSFSTILGHFYEAPTLQMAMKWLREVYKLYINVCPSVEGYYWTEKWHSYVENLEKRYPFGRFIGTFTSHEQACEAAIKYCLTNLI